MNEINVVAMMNKATEVEQILKERGHNYTVTYKRVWKNNVELDGLMLAREDEEYGTANPTIYFSDETSEELADRIEEQIISRDHPIFDFATIFTPEYFAENLRPRLITDNGFNRERMDNDNVWYKRFDETDILITLEVEISHNEGERATFLMKRDVLEKIGISEEAALMYAIRNIEKAVMIKSMSEIMAEMLGMPWEEISGIEEEDNSMYVLTTTDKINGAACILSNTVLDMLTDRMKCKDLFILPSSVHEVIAIPNHGTEDAKSLLAMVREVNETQVQPNERLMDGVLAYTNGQLYQVA